MRYRQIYRQGTDPVIVDVHKKIVARPYGLVEDKTIIRYLHLRGWKICRGSGRTRTACCYETEDQNEGQEDGFHHGGISFFPQDNGSVENSPAAARFCRARDLLIMVVRGMGLSAFTISFFWMGLPFRGEKPDVQLQ